MLASVNVLNRDARRSLLRSAGVREFAEREFPREDYHWVVCAARSAISGDRGDGTVRQPIVRGVGTPRKAQADRKPAGEPSATA